MATLSYAAIIGNWWSGEVNISYNAVYDPAANKTTVTFGECNHKYFGRSGWGTSASTSLTVMANDNQSSKGTATFSTYGTTNGGTATFSGTPSPASITVQHAEGTGIKAVVISGSTTIKVYATTTATSQSTATGSGSVSTSLATAYILTLTRGTGVSSLAAAISSSSLRATGTSVVSGGMIYAGEVIKLTYSAASGYTNATCNVSNIGVVASGGTFAVGGNHAAAASATAIPYSLTITVDSGVSAIVKKGNATLSSGATIYYGDSLSITFGGKTGYKIASATLNSKNILSPTTHSVTGNVILAISSSPEGFIWLCVGGALRAYLPIIYDETAWKRYRGIIGNSNGGFTDY